MDSNFDVRLPWVQYLKKFRKEIYSFHPQAVINNDENVILTSNEILVKKFLEQFEKLWRDNEDPVWHFQLDSSNIVIHFFR